MWKTGFGNNCFRGCLVYLGVLAIVVVVGAVGLGGLSARFGGSSQTANLTVASQPVKSVSQPAQNTSAQPETTPTAALAPAPQASPPPLNVASAPQVQAQGGVISGQASGPSYVVQGADTQWAVGQA